MRVIAVAVVLLAAVVASGPVAAAPPHPLTTAVYLDPESHDPHAALAFARTRAAGADVVRLILYWYQVAPQTRPAGFHAADPRDPAYRWSAFDRAVRLAARAGLKPLVTILGAPSWAQGKPAAAPPASYKPSPNALADFATAAALRYSGRVGGLPRIRYWQAWNEPNLSIYLAPQIVDGKPFAPAWYRRMLTAFGAAVHRVARDNVVVAGGLAPFRDVTPDVQSADPDWGPLSFLRALLCLSTDLRATCSARTTADVWAIHPYTSGGPSHHAQLPNDLSLGDLPKLRRTLTAAAAVGHLTTRSPQIWVTEFSWDSSPPDPRGVPVRTLERWVPEALFRLWANGVSLVTWFTLRDQPLATSFYQSGLYYAGRSLVSDRRKPYLEGFRFPFVAFRAGARVSVWARPPGARAQTLRIQQLTNTRWQTVATLRTDRFGIATAHVAPLGRGPLRAVAPSGEASLPFSLKSLPDHVYNPFGQTSLGHP